MLLKGDWIMKCVIFKAACIENNIDKEINVYLSKGWTVHSITPILAAWGDASVTSELVIIFNTQGIA